MVLEEVVSEQPTRDEFWQKYFPGSESSSKFPSISSKLRQIQRTSAVELPDSVTVGPEDAKSTHRIIQTAWALLLRQYTESTDAVTIACAILGPQQKVDECPVFPIKFSISSNERLTKLCCHADDISRQAVSSPCPATLLQDTGVTNTVLVIQNLQHELSTLDASTSLGGGHNQCALLLHVGLTPAQIRFQAIFDPHVLQKSQAKRVLQQLDHIVQQLLSLKEDSAMCVGELNVQSPQDHQDIAKWNSGPADGEDACIHVSVFEHAKSRPHALAVSGHDGDLTYAELDTLTTQLAHLMRSLGIGPGCYVPTLFVKSKWTLVAVLAILKAGAAFVMLDPAHPPKRNQLICNQVHASVALVGSASLQEALQPVVAKVLELSDNTVAEPSWGLSVDPAQPMPTLPPSVPSASAYVLFTSGSTGTPKGAVLAHRSFVRAARGVISATRMDTTTRTLQYASYSFGAAVMEMLATLMAGGRVCVPSDAMRLSGGAPLMAFLAAQRVTWAFLTPSLARTTFEPAAAAAAGLRVLATGGEVVAPDLVAAWAPHVALFAVYGSAEQSTINTMQQLTVEGATNENDAGELIAGGVGRLFPGCYGWLVDPEPGANRLVPVGCAGELVLEGPLVAEGYLDMPETTAKAFPDRASLAWRGDFAEHPNGPMRFYRTGDLLRFRENGTLEFVSRKDGYIKLRGQRIELGEVEFSIKQVTKTKLDLCVEVIAPKRSGAKDEHDTDEAVLMVFVALGAAYHGSSSEDEQGQDGVTPFPSVENMRRLADDLGDLDEALAEHLPSHMIPHYFYPLQTLPSTVSGKILRKSLREELGARISAGQLVDLTLGRHRAQNKDGDCSTAESSAWTDSTEVYLRSVWSEILGVPASVIRREDSFFGVGGDSLTAMKLFSRLRLDGYDLNVPEIRATPVLWQMAAKCQEFDEEEDEA